LKNGKTLEKMKFPNLEKQNESFKPNAEKQIEAFKGNAQEIQLKITFMTTDLEAAETPVAVEHITASPVAAIKDKIEEFLNLIKAIKTKQKAKKERTVPTEVFPTNPKDLLSITKKPAFNDVESQETTIEPASLKVANDKVQTAAAVPADVETELSQPSNMKLILVSLLFSSCCALYVDQAAHVPHHQPRLGAQHCGDECSTYPQTECWDVEKPQMEQETIYENCVTVYDTICDIISAKTCSVAYDKDCSTVFNRLCRKEEEQLCHGKPQEQCKGVSTRKCSTPYQRKTLEIHPRHPLIKELVSRVKNNPADDDSLDMDVMKHTPEGWKDDETLPHGWKTISQIHNVRTKPVDCNLCDQVS
jgi:hypothetical protein